LRSATLLACSTETILHGHTASSKSSLEQLQHLLLLASLVTCADGRVDDGGADTARPDSLNSYSHTANQVKHTDRHLLEQLQRLLPLAALVACADGRIGDGGVRPHPNALKLAQSYSKPRPTHTQKHSFAVDLAR
jgi:hypothetical protein